MKPRDPYRTEPLEGGGRCICQGAHVQGLATANRKTRGQYMTEPSATTSIHRSRACPHSDLERTTGVTNLPRRSRRTTRPIRLSL